MSVLPGTKAFSFYRGDTFSVTMTYKEGGLGVPLTGATVAAKFRSSVSSESSTSFVVTVSNQVSLPGEFTISLSPAVTAAVTNLQSAYDIQITWPSGEVQTILRGTLTLIEDVTR